MINIYPMHYLLSHVLPQIFKGFVSFSWVAKSFVVDISGKSMVSAALHVNGNQVDANLGRTSMKTDFIHFGAANGRFLCFNPVYGRHIVYYLLLFQQQNPFFQEKLKT